METKYYILMSFEQGQLVASWHFKAVKENRLAKKIMTHLLTIVQNAESVLESVLESMGYQLENPTEPLTIHFILEVLEKIAILNAANGQPCYKLYEMETSYNGSALVEVKKWTNLETEKTIQNKKQTKQTKQTKQSKAKSDYIKFVPLWKEKIDLSIYEANKSDFIMLWVKNLPGLWLLERDYFDEAVAQRSKKPETICVYFLNNAPVYIHRRSTLNTRYEWLMWVNELDGYWNYEKKTWIEREHRKQEKAMTELEKQEAFELKAAIKAAQQIEKEASKKAAKEKSEALEKEYQAAKAHLIEMGKAKYEQQKQEWKIYKDECWYHANVWLYGHTQEAMHNNIEWQLAEQEEALAEIYDKLKDVDFDQGGEEDEDGIPGSR